jgi:class 3 adenylate cyclase
MVSEEVREALLLGNQLQLSGELKIVSVLFTDIRQFTRFSESHSPQETVAMLNNHFGIINSAVNKAGGLIDKFSGDGTMAIFGAPVSLEPGETAYRALRAALLIRIRISESNAHRVRNGQEPINIGIGINTGEAITGNIGAEDRFEYTAIGDTVNVAFRVQSLAGLPTGSNIFITQGTHKALAEHERLLFGNQGAVTIKGRAKPVHVYSFVGVRKAGTSSHTMPADPPIPGDEVLSYDLLETAYLYCRGFDPTTIAGTKYLPLETVQSQIREAASQFEQVKQELQQEFGLTDTELQHLTEAPFL